MKSLTDKDIDGLITQMIDTFKFHGVTITSFNIEKSGKPHITISIDKQKMYRTLQDTLDFVYWSVWTLLYGEYTDDKKKLELILDYTEEKNNESR